VRAFAIGREPDRGSIVDHRRGGRPSRRFFRPTDARRSGGARARRLDARPGLR